MIYYIRKVSRRFYIMRMFVLQRKMLREDCIMAEAGNI